VDYGDGSDLLLLASIQYVYWVGDNKNNKNNNKDTLDIFTCGLKRFN
jgi:hypothetical protein